MRIAPLIIWIGLAVLARLALPGDIGIACYGSCMAFLGYSFRGLR